MSYFHHSKLATPLALSAGAASIAGIAIIFALKIAFLKDTKTRPRVLQSPSVTQIIKLSSEEVAKLPYPPNYFPGKRDIKTPYGVMRVYEWGPERGRKVLFVHGDSTPSPMLGPIARNLVEKGCRVILFDLWGRGYSDTPLDHNHDAKLFSRQILFAITSSPLPWASPFSGGFSIVAFSLGGGISISFLAEFSYLVDSIVLLAPSGLIRTLPAEYEWRCFRHTSLFSETYLRRQVGRLLGVRLDNRRDISRSKASSTSDDGEKKGPAAISYGDPDVSAIIQWQFDHHEGFAQSFVNTIRHGPIRDGQTSWEDIRDILSLTGSDPRFDSKQQSEGVQPNPKIMVIFGEDDQIVREKEVSDDIVQIVGSDHIIFRNVPGGHGFPVSSAGAVTKLISEFWGL